MKDKITPVVLGLVGLALTAALVAPRTHFEAPRESQPAPNFPLTLNGQVTELAALRGRVVVLNFWATWCPPCVDEMPSLQRLHESLSDEGLVVLGISVDESRAAYENFLRTHGITFPNHHDPEKRISTLYGTFMYPETYIISKNGLLVRKVIGPLEWDGLSVMQFLQDLLDAPSS